MAFKNNCDVYISLLFVLSCLQSSTQLPSGKGEIQYRNIPHEELSAIISNDQIWRRKRQADILFPNENDALIIEDRYADFGRGNRGQNNQIPQAVNWNGNGRQRGNNWNGNGRQRGNNWNDNGRQRGNNWNGNNNWNANPQQGGNWNQNQQQGWNGNQQGGNWNGNQQQGGNNQPNSTPQQIAGTTMRPTPRPGCVPTCTSITPEYNPVCSSNGQSYDNMSRLECERRCGVNTQFVRYGRCPMPATN